jgi:murein hydrolase activator
MKSNTYFIVFFIFFLGSLATVGQTRKQLENQRKKYNSEIQKLNKLLFNEERKEKNALEDLKDLNQKITVRSKLIKTIKLEATVLNKEINKNNSKVKELNKNLSDLKKDYANMIFKSYKSKSQQSRMMFLLSSQNFYQAYKRMEYMKQYTSFRKKQGEGIEFQKEIIKKYTDSLVTQKQIKDTLIVSENNQKKAIESDKKNQENLISKIKKKENKYKREIKKNIKEEKKVAARIDKIIKDEIARANRIARAKLKKKPKASKTNEFILSPEAKALALKFEQNKGSLPWPVKEGLVVRKFGKQPHPTFPGITINGTGLHIVTSNGSNAEAIFNGVVLNILVSSGGTKNVLIKHGNYITSYNNLETAFVKKGDKVTTGQKIGRIFTDKVSKKTKLVFVLFKNTTRLNPAQWMMKM